MNIGGICLLVIVTAVIAQGEEIREFTVDSEEMEGSSDGSYLSDILFTQYRVLFRDLLGRRCIYYPSCSHYGQEAVESKGVVLGMMMAIERWTRCNSAAFSHGDYMRTDGNRLADPVDPGEDVTCWGRLLLPF